MYPFSFKKERKIFQREKMVEKSGSSNAGSSKPGEVDLSSLAASSEMPTCDAGSNWLLCLAAMVPSASTT